MGRPWHCTPGGPVQGRVVSSTSAEKQDMTEERPFGRVVRDTYAGAVLYKEMYTIPPRLRVPDKTVEIKPRFQSVEERKEHASRMARKRHTQLVNANFRPGDLYLTLTFDQKNECHCYADAKGLTLKYIRRIRRIYKSTVIFWYIGKGENTKRYHVHLLMNGVPEHFAVQKWTYGKIEDVNHLWAHCIYDGIDNGPNFEALANYLFDHWEPEQGPHRYHHTRNAKKPETSAYRPCRRKYSDDHPPKAPKGYKLVKSISTRYGYQCFVYVKEPKEPFLDFDYGIKKPKHSRRRRTRAEDEQK